MKYVSSSLNLSFESRPETKRGTMGEYIQLDSKTGIKVLRQSKSNVSFQNEIDLLNSEFYKEAQNEFNALVLLKDSGITPKAYCLVTVEAEDGDYYPAILMEHLFGVSLDAVSFASLMLNSESLTSVEDVLKKLDSIFESFGVCHGDLFPKNLLICKNEIKVIDFGLSSLIG